MNRPNAPTAGDAIELRSLHAILRAAAGAAVALALTACGGAHSTAAAPNAVQQTVQTLQAQGKLPTLDVTSSIGGTDADHNGVRDDLDSLIDAQADTAAQKASLSQLAKALQATLTVDVGDATAKAAAADAVNRGVACVWTTYSDDAAPTKVLLMQQLTVNTMTRLTAYEKFNSAMDGSVTQYPSGVICAV